MQVLTVLLPYMRTISNIALTCGSLRDWLSNNGFPIRTSMRELHLENISFYKALNYPNLEMYMKDQMYRSIESGDPEILDWLLSEGVDIEELYMFRKTAIFQAVYYSLDCLKLLLERGADVAARDIYEQIALHTAAIYNKPKALKLLLEQGADTDAKNRDGMTTLHFAVIYSRVEFLQVLLEYKADIDAGDTNGDTALHFAAIHDKPDCLKLLLENGANRDATNNCGVTVLTFAKGKAECQRLLKGAIGSDSIL